MCKIYYGHSPSGDLSGHSGEKKGASEARLRPQGLASSSSSEATPEFKLHLTDILIQSKSAGVWYS